MGDLAVRLKNGAERKRYDSLSPHERKAVGIIQADAAKVGSLLASDGIGGLAPSFVLGILRRDHFRCTVCGQKGNDDNGGIELHHLGGIVDCARNAIAGHKVTQANVVTICAHCHDAAHETARADGTDSSQVTPAGDMTRSQLERVVK